MPYLNFNSASPALKLAITFMSIIAIGVIVSFVGFLLSRVFFWIDVHTANDLLHQNYSTSSLAQHKYYQIIQSVGFFVVPGVFLHWLFSTPTESYFNISKKPKLYSALLLLVILIVSIPFVNYLVAYNKSIVFPEALSKLENTLLELEQAAASFTSQLLTTSNFGGYLINILMIAIIPAIGEEFIFRGVLQKIFFDVAKNKHMAILLAAILFSAVHVQFYGFIPRFFLGVFFGYLLLWGKTIWLPVLAHFINNAIVVTLYYLYGIGIVELPPDKLGGNIFGAIGIVVSLILVFMGIFLLKKIEQKSLVE
jgi:membrane protease YdiL (CAAX protease family)